MTIATTTQCTDVYQIANLLSPPSKYSIISSSLWNEIVQDLYLTYSVFQYINFLSAFPYTDYIFPAIQQFNNFPQNFTPYTFTPLLNAQTGTPLNADDFNNLINAIIKLANMANIQLQTKLDYVQPNEIVKASQFANVIYAVNQLLTFNYNTYFILSCSGAEFINLLNTQTTFLNVLIYNLSNNLSVSNNTYIKNLLLNSLSQNIYNYGIIDKLVIVSSNGNIYLYNNAFINSLTINNNIQNIYINNNSSIGTLSISYNTGKIYLNGNAFINTLFIDTHNGYIYVNDNSVINNLICNTNAGAVIIAPTAVVINNQCT